MPLTKSRQDRRATQEQFAEAVRHIDAKLEKARYNVEAFDTKFDDYEELRGILKDLPEKVTHPVMVPYGPLAFFEGHLEHTNEVLVQLSSEYFVLHTTKDAMGTVDRRQKRLRKERQQAGRELMELEQQRQLAAEEAGPLAPAPPGAAKPGAVVAAPSDAPVGTKVTVDEEGFMDIREPVFDGDPGGVQAVLGVTHDDDDDDDDDQIRKAPPDVVAASLARMRELERLEELEELEGLDDLMASYEQGASAGPCGDDAFHESPAAAAVRAQAAVPVAEPQDAPRSPADLSRFMDAVEKAARDEAPGQAPDAAAFPGTVLERSAPIAAVSTATGATASAPEKKVSKFKADRQRAGR